MAVRTGTRISVHDTPQPIIDALALIWTKETAKGATWVEVKAANGTALVFFAENEPSDV